MSEEALLEQLRTLEEHHQAHHRTEAELRKALTFEGNPINRLKGEIESLVLPLPSAGQPNLEYILGWNAALKKLREFIKP